jgi:hypothetical protein
VGRRWPDSPGRIDFAADSLWLSAVIGYDGEER